VAGIFGSAEAAEWVIESLRDNGFSPDQVSVLARFMRDVDTIATRIDLDEADGAAAIGPETLNLPGVGEVVGAGTLATTLAGPGVGNLCWALIDMGVPATAAASYTQEVRDGGILVTVAANTARQASQAQRIFRLCSGLEVHDFGIEADLNH
jgi:hypothetical protein